MLRRSAPVVALVGAILFAPMARAQEIELQGPLGAIQIERRLYRAGRLHVAALPSLVVGGARDGTLALAARADFHPTDGVGLGMWGAHGVRIGEARGLGWAGAGQLTVIPAHGKLALLEEVIVRIDLFAFGGVGALTADDTTRLGATFGGGMVLYLGEAAALTLEARAVGSLLLLSSGVVLALPPEARRECVVR